jgi:hypothetical protein
MDNFDLKKFVSEKTLLNENAPGYDTRKQGEALPTLESVKAAYEAKNDIKEDVLEEAYTFADANDDNVKAIQKELIPVLKASIEKALMDWAKKNPDNEYGKADFGRAVGMIAFDSLD